MSTKKSKNSKQGRKKTKLEESSQDDLTLSPYFNKPQETDIEDLNSDTWVPANWKQILELIEEMRIKESAPVDTMGCHKCADPSNSPADQRFQHLLALMLSSQTKDQVTYAAMERLKNACTDNMITIKEILGFSQSKLETLLNPVSFYRVKSKNILKTCKILEESYNNDIPDTAQKLCTLPGVGPKMAHICMLTAWNKVSGIGVDTHVHRISNRLGWCKSKTKTPEETRKQLEGWLPMEYWPKINELLVGFGQTVCTPVRPKCQSCLCNKLCPLARKVIK